MTAFQAVYVGSIPIARSMILGKSFFNLRKAEQEDKENILKIIRSLHLNMPDFIWDREDFVKKQIIQSEYFVAEIDGELAGVASFRKKRNKMYIETLAVDNKYRMRGIGSELVEFGKRLAKENDSDVLCACSFFEYEIGDFYIKRGFSLLKKPGIYNNHKYHRFEAKIK